MGSNGKYRVKQVEVERVARLEVCIGCGKEQTRNYPAFRPVANPTDKSAPNRLNCFMGLHNFVDVSLVEANI